MSIDELLSQPLPAVADNGFSAHVMGRIRGAERMQTALIGTLAAVVATAICLVMPLDKFFADLNAVVLDLGTSKAVAGAGAALVMTFLLDRFLTTFFGAKSFF